MIRHLFIGQTPHYLLPQPFQRNNPRRTYILVNNDGYLDALAPHLTEQLAGFLGFGNEDGWVDDFAQRPVVVAGSWARASKPSLMDAKPMTWSRLSCRSGSGNGRRC
jgi:hypothetical protein